VGAGGKCVDEILRCGEGRRVVAGRLNRVAARIPGTHDNVTYNAIRRMM